MSETHPGTSSREPSRKNRLLALAAATAALWLVIEFAARRGLASLLVEPLGSALGAQVAVSVVYLPTLALVIGWLSHRVGITSSEWAYALSLRRVGGALMGLVGIYVFRAGAVAILVFGLGYALPGSGEATSALGLGNAPVWVLGSFVVINGLLVPVVEEFAWRGVIQTALTESYGSAVAVMVTAAAFVLKHIVVDLGASPFRATALVILAFGLCLIRAKYGTASSTIAHAGMNSLETGALVLSVL